MKSTFLAPYRPGAELVRLATVLDVAAILGLATHLVFTADMPPVLTVPLLAFPVVGLVLFYVSCARGMEDMTLRVRRILGILVPVMVLASAAAKGAFERLFAMSPALLTPLATMPFGAYAAHRALALAARERERASAARRALREMREGRDVEAPPSASEPHAAPARRRTAMGALVLLSGFVLLGAGVIEAFLRMFWFGLVWMAMGGLCLRLSRDFGAPSSDRRLRRGDRGSQAAWLLAPIGALVAAVRAAWILLSAP